jgi:hypothetical protein
LIIRSRKLPALSVQGFGENAWTNHSGSEMVEKDD